MKRFLMILLCCIFSLSLFACSINSGPDVPPADNGNENQNENENNNGDNGMNEQNKVIIKDSNSLNYSFGLDEQIKDEANGFSSSSDLTGGRFMINGKYADKFTQVNNRYDMKLELFNEDSVRIVNLSGGVAYTLPSTEIDVDYTIAKYRTVISFEDSILSASVEGSNPYMNTETPWYIYGSEWLLEHLLNEDYYKNQKLKLLKGTDCNFNQSSKNHNYGDTTTKPGFDIYRFDIEIEYAEKIERPFYNIAVVRKIGDEKNFNLFVMKSKSNKSEVMDKLVQSMKLLTPKGVQRNYFDAGEAIEDKNWNEETRNYFRQISTSKTLNWGVFSWSISGTELEPGQGDYNTNYKNSKDMKDGIEAAMDYKYDIYPTYTHISWGTQEHRFNTNMSLALAGGNGKNGKPVLQFTYQFTTNNNLVDQQTTPMFDILRGKYDMQFRRLAQDIKKYDKPVLFRLNNEMNTDWTSYCGMITLLDPDVFNLTWQRLYKIFINEGVKNVIWIWNPIAKSCPYSSWGEDLCYFPGKEYVQLLGATNYEMNNYIPGGNEKIESFQKRYSELYKKNCEGGFGKWGVIISEFGCGSGGEIMPNGTIPAGGNGRNRDAQAEWVKGMFDEFCKDPQPDYVQQLKGMVWFNCNDYKSSGGSEKVMNRLRIYQPAGQGRPGEDYSDLAQTINAFKDGFSRLSKKYGK